MVEIPEFLGSLKPEEFGDFVNERLDFQVLSSS